MLDLGTYVVMGGFSMMARKTWNEDTNDAPVPDKYARHCFELYFEENRLDDFIAELHKNTGIKKSASYRSSVGTTHNPFF
jgi:hypothetical protein